MEPVPAAPPSPLPNERIGGTFAVSRDDVAAVAVITSLTGGCVLLGLAVGPVEGLGLFFALLAGWGLLTLRSLREGDGLAAHRDEPEP